ncbi:MAG: SDR family oxidoreductase [Deltaproteobacteria bacterium]|nr:SDR family oxidoreductase [Deltaproteobacteria bacterium]
MSAEILIAGCGYLGSALGKLLAQNGHKVWGLRRNPESTPGVLPITANLLEPASLDLPCTIDVVVYTAAPGHGHDQAYEDIYVRGVAHLLQALKTMKITPRRLLLTSSTSVYQQNKGEWVDEESKTTPRTTTSQWVLKGEELWRQAPWPSTIVRLSGIYGPGRRRLINQARKGEHALVTSLHWTNRIHRDDAAGFLAWLVELPSAETLYLGTDSYPVPRHEVEAWIAQRLAIPAPERCLDQRQHNKRCRNDRMLATGYVLHYPTFKEGYEGLLAKEA